jgi:hypothetical protein
MGSNGGPNNSQNDKEEECVGKEEGCAAIDNQKCGVFVLKMTKNGKTWPLMYTNYATVLLKKAYSELYKLKSRLKTNLKHTKEHKEDLKVIKCEAYKAYSPLSL